MSSEPRPSDFRLAHPSSPSGRRQDDAEDAHPDREPPRAPLLGLAHHAQAARQRDRRARIPLRRPRDVSSDGASGRVRGVGRGARQPLRHEPARDRDRAGRAPRRGLRHRLPGRAADQGELPDAVGGVHPAAVAGRARAAPARSRASDDEETMQRRLSNARGRDRALWLLRLRRSSTTSSSARTSSSTPSCSPNGAARSERSRAPLPSGLLRRREGRTLMATCSASSAAAASTTLDGLDGVEEVARRRRPYGAPSDVIVRGRRWDDTTLLFLPRHGRGHRIPPSAINYRANICALKKLGATHARQRVSAVGSMSEEIAPGRPRRSSTSSSISPSAASRTFFDDGVVAHVAFADPVCPHLGRGRSHAAANATGARVHRGGTYVCIEGPQFSTRAESRVYRELGRRVIGMTNMPEAKLAREAELPYATLALATDYDCWHESDDDVTVEAVLAVLHAERRARARRSLARARRAPARPREEPRHAARSRARDHDRPRRISAPQQRAELGWLCSHRYARADQAARMEFHERASSPSSSSAPWRSTTSSCPPAPPTNVVGGSATYSSIAASLFAPVRLVAVVGDDFPARRPRATVATRGVDTRGRRARRRQDLPLGRALRRRPRRAATTLDTQLNVFADFRPKIPEAYATRPTCCSATSTRRCSSRCSTQIEKPEARRRRHDELLDRGRARSARRRCSSASTCSSSTTRRRASSRGSTTSAKARQGHPASAGPKRLIIKRGEHGALLFDDESTFFAARPIPLEDVVDPDRRGRHVRRRLRRATSPRPATLGPRHAPRHDGQAPRGVVLRRGGRHRAKSGGSAISDLSASLDLFRNLMHVAHDASLTSS